MLMSGTFALAVLLASPDAASAASQSNPFRHVSCVVVRFYVAKYSEPTAEAWARGHGATEAEIDGARQCLKGQSPAQPIPAATVITAR
jgi:hypothetical protein